MLEITEVNTKESMNSLACLFGKSMGSGVQKILPPVGAGEISVGVNNNINLLVPSDTNKNKGSFRYDSAISKLNVTVCYSNFLIQNSGTFMELLVDLPQRGVDRCT